MKKLNLGVTFYGRKFDSEDPNPNQVYPPMVRDTESYPIVNNRIIKLLNPIVRFEEYRKVPYPIVDGNWITYEEER